VPEEPVLRVGRLTVPLPDAVTVSRVEDSESEADEDSEADSVVEAEAEREAEALDVVDAAELLDTRELALLPEMVKGPRKLGVAPGWRISRA
jgi:hypothetical protein